MSREIKFRAWEEKSNYMFTWRELKNQQLDLSNIKNYSIFEDNSLELMQYTGLKDKNGVDIYVSDILEFESPLFEKKPSPNPKCIGTTKELAKVDLTIGGFVFVRKFWWNDKFYPDMGDALADMQTKSWIQANCKVIGNIYENKELLEN